jgi:hypothetical protein
MTDRDAGLTARLGRRGVAIMGDGSITDALRSRLRASGCVVVRGVSDEVDAAVVSLQSLPAAPAELGARLLEVVAVMRSSSPLRHVVVIVPSSDGAAIGSAASALARTLAIYATAHTADRDVRLNVVRVSARPEPGTLTRIGDVTLMLICGLLDAMRGQTLVIDDERRQETTT